MEDGRCQVFKEICVRLQGVSKSGPHDQLSLICTYICNI